MGCYSELDIVPSDFVLLVLPNNGSMPELNKADSDTNEMVLYFMM